MTDLLAALVDCVTGDEAFDLLVRSPGTVEAVLAHPVAEILEPETLDILRRLRAAHREVIAGGGGEIIVNVLCDDGVTRYEAAF